MNSVTKTPSDPLFKYIIVRVEDLYSRLSTEPYRKIISITDDEDKAKYIAKSNVKKCTEHGIVCGVEVYKYKLKDILKRLYEQEDLNILFDNEALMKDKKMIQKIMELDYAGVDFYEDTYEQIDPDAILLYYEHQTHMNYAFGIKKIERARNAGVSSVRDLPPHVDQCYRPYAMVTTNEELLEAIKGETKDYFFTRIHSGWGIIHQWLLDEGLIQDIPEVEEDK